MNKTLSILFLLLFCICCKNKPNCKLDAKVLKTNDSILLSIKKEKSLSIFLYKMKESELETFSGESYRFIIAGAFGNNKIYRVNENANGYVITSKSFFSYRETKNDVIVIDSFGKMKQTPISTSQWIEIKNSIDKLNFWMLPVKIKDNHYLDGANYIIEGYNPEKNECTDRYFHATGRVCPADTTKYKRLFNKVIKLTSK